MKVISIISQKGEAGKTTLALHLAVAFEHRNKPCAIIDLDPQASATNWKDYREKNDPVVVSAQASRLNHILSTAKSAGAKICILDTAPHSESSSLAAARMADIILIPCRPAILDLRAISNTIDLARIANKSVFVVLNAVPARGSLALEAKKAIEGYGVDVSPIHIVQRSSFIHSLTLGLTAQEYEPKGKGAEEINQLYKWINKKLDI
jgi:chromosome partitioning protein